VKNRDQKYIWQDCMPDAKERRGETTSSDSDKSPRTSEANVGVSVDADGDANMRSEQV